MSKSAVFLVFALTAIGIATHAADAIPELEPYPLPAEVRHSLVELAGACDVLILGETHGTKEVPAIVVALLEEQSKSGYGSIALEVARDQQRAIEAWATGRTDVLPTFFAKPGADGRGNREALAMVRRALRPQYEWKLICFDETELELSRQMMERLPKDSEGTIAGLGAKLSTEDVVALSKQRDASMARYLEAGRGELSAGEKVLAICGNFHARTANHMPEEHPMAAFWPSFAAKLAGDDPTLRVRSVNIQAFDGEYFNGGKVQRFSPRPLAQVESRRTPDGDWDAELNLPQATVATFIDPIAGGGK